MVCTIKDLPTVPAIGSVPVRRFSWRTGQKNRPGLQFLVSTGRHHGFESLAERDLLLALDFAAAPSEMLSQPFTLRFATHPGPSRTHNPPQYVETGSSGTAQPTSSSPALTPSVTTPPYATISSTALTS